jgi:predicted acyl esterase
VLTMRSLIHVACIVTVLTLSASAAEADDSVTSLPSETPETFTPRTEAFDHVRREAMIPMRDGEKLKTIILIPKGAAGAPMLLTRTPYLFASTSGGDSDWVVKIIDVWPNEVPERPLLGGYQQMLSADIFRGRYRVDPAKPQALAPNKALPYRIALPHASHTFLPGHRIMVQVQSSWFPLYDRNPQTFVPSIMYAKPESYVKATQRIWRAPGGASAIELPVVRAN